MNDDKAIRAAKLTLGGILEKNRAKEAKERAPGQIAPSKYMPNVPRAVHAAGGYVPAPMMQGTPRLAVARAPIQEPQQNADVLASLSSLTDTIKSFRGEEDAPPVPDTAPAREPHADRAEPHGYGEGISAAAAKAMSGLQGAWTGQDFGIVSGYRDPDQNAAAKGAKNSQHLHGNAFDVNTTGWSEADKLALADAAWEQGFRGFGFYNNNMHFDVGDPRGWGPSFSRDSIPDWARGWTANRYGYAEGGEVADLGQAREQKQIKQYHTGLMGDVKTSVNSMMEAHQKALDAGVFDGYEVGDTLQGSAHPMRITGRFMRKWKPSSMALQSFDRMGAKPTIIEHEDTQYIPMLRYQTGVEGQDGFQEGDAYLDGVKAAGYQKMGGLRSVKAEGGPVMTQEQIEDAMPPQPGGGQKAQDALDDVGRAGRIGGIVGRASGVPLGSIVGRKVAEQIAMSGYANGGRTITDHGLYSKAAEIIRSLPQEKNTVDQYIAAAKKLGAKPSEIEHAGRPEGDKISREDMAKHFDRNLPKMEVHQYGENPSYLSKEQEKRIYELWGKPKSEAEEAENELLMRRTKGPQVKYESSEYNEDNEPTPTQYHDYTLPGGSNYRERLLTLPREQKADGYQSSHWEDANVLAHIRMSDRTMGGDRESMRPVGEKLAQRFGVNLRDLSSGSALTGVKEGLITPEEGATFSRLMRWNNGLQDKPGLDKRVLHVEEMQSDWGQEGKKQGFYDPKNPYEIFNSDTGETVSAHPSQDAMWDAYRSMPEDQAANLDYGHARYTSEKRPAAPYVQNTQHWTDLALKNIMHEAAMGGYDHVAFTPGQAHADRYGMQGEGMKGYYDNILPKSVMRLAQQHDPDIKPGSMPLPEGHTGFSIPMTDKLKQGILGGQTAFKRGGTVDVEKALGITRGFTKDGKAATMRLKLKE